MCPSDQSKQKVYDADAPWSNPENEAPATCPSQEWLQKPLLWDHI